MDFRCILGGLKRATQKNYGFKIPVVNFCLRILQEEMGAKIFFPIGIFLVMSLMCSSVILVKVGFCGSCHVLSSPSATFKRDIKIADGHLSEMKVLLERQFHRPLKNLYSMSIPLKNFRTWIFIKKWQKLLPWQAC